MTTKTWLKSFILALAVILSACSGEAKNTEKKEATKEISEKVKVTDQKEEPAAEPAASIEEEGTYIGQIDNNSIEVEAAGDTLVLRLTDEVRDTVANLEDGSKVSIVYKKTKMINGFSKRLQLLNLEQVNRLPHKLLNMMSMETRLRRKLL
ncbi:hypothetical protein [Fictibacillus arsenicus]|uniref:DUF3221 domain-containing protein n=1 Tax=Fictibacillus arsenicus TaxID=255247 RepID=A0A1V3G795_9BACL|nr:hypothetical protein [Fictibacillus arsenicus]OOE12251.1 hypothetical protein UN64_09045 [Fictibacillus arsenicus]